MIGILGKFRARAGVLLIAFLILCNMPFSTAISGPLKVSTQNPRYFADSSGNIVYLTGTHTWCNLQDCAEVDSPLQVFDYSGYVDFMESTHQDFMRLWMYENYENDHPTPYYFEPLPWKRSSISGALDGGNKFDLTKFNQAYFDRLRSRMIEAGNHGIYVSIMLFQGWSLGDTAWPGNPFNFANNINSIDGDIAGDGKGYGTHSLQDPEIVALQESYVRKVIDTVNDLDNVLYEISNEDPAGDAGWQHHMIDTIHDYEMTKPRQHPVGMTFPWPGGSDEELYSSNADWVSPASEGSADYETDPPVADGQKVVLLDSDHLNPAHTRESAWVWKSFLRGYNPLLMDDYPNNNAASRILYRKASGYTADYAEKMDLGDMLPSSTASDCSTGYCLRNPGQEYLIFQPGSGVFKVNLAAGDYVYEWFNPSSGTFTETGTITATGGSKSFTPPFTGDAVLYLNISAASSCGDGTCDTGSGEDCSGCPDDCGTCPQELITHYTFDETSGTIAHDSSGNSNDGTLVNGPTWTTGKIGNALKFDGVDDYVDVGDLDITPAITLSAWIKAGAVKLNQRIISKWDGSYLISTDNSKSNGFTFAVKDSSTKFDVCDSNTLGNYSVGNWVFVTGTYNGTTCKIYINGIDRTDVMWDNANGSIQNTAFTTKIGAEGSDGSYTFNGTIDDVRIYNYAFSPSEILDLYNQGTGSSCNSTADSNSDGIITIAELINYISKWTAGTVTISGLIDAIGKWKSGC